MVIKMLTTLIIHLEGIDLKMCNLRRARMTFYIVLKFIKWYISLLFILWLTEILCCTLIKLQMKMLKNKYEIII